MEKKEYLGDGVYAYFDGYHVVLQADANIIYLEPEVYESLNRYVEDLRQRLEVKKEGYDS